MANANIPRQHSPPAFDKLSTESTELFKKHHNLSTLRLIIQSHRWPNLHLDLLGVFNLQQRSLTKSKLAVSNLDAGLLFCKHDRLHFGPVRLQVGTRVALNNPLISGSLRAFTSGDWYRLDGQVNFEAGDTRRFAMSAVFKLANGLYFGSKNEIDQTDSIGRIFWMVKYQPHQELWSLMAVLEDSCKWSTFATRQGLYHIPHHSRKNVTLGAYQQMSKSSSLISHGLEIHFGADYPQFPVFAFGCTNPINKQILLKTKIDSTGMIGLTGVFTLASGVIASISSHLSSNLKGTRFGCGLEIRE